MQREYNKAIRDRIPEIIRGSGLECSIQQLSDQDFLPYIEEKLIEESDEYFTNRSPEELCDILEVVYRLAELRGVSEEELNSMRLKKREERGAFSKNYVLLRVSDEGTDR